MPNYGTTRPQAIDVSIADLFLNHPTDIGSGLVDKIVKAIHHKNAVGMSRPYIPIYMSSLFINKHKLDRSHPPRPPLPLPRQIRPPQIIPRSNILY